MSDSARQAIDIAQRRAKQSGGFLTLQDFLIAWLEELSWADCAIARGLGEDKLFPGRGELIHERESVAAGLFPARGYMALRPTDVARQAEIIASKRGSDLIMESHLLRALFEGRVTEFESLGLHTTGLIEFVQATEVIGPVRETQVFLPGQRHVALQQFIDLTKQAQRTLALADSYVDARVLALMTEKKPGTAVSILTRKPTPAFLEAARAFSAEYGPLHIRTSDAFHDRFLIVDDGLVWHLGASIKDAGEKTFRMSPVEAAPEAKRIVGEFAAAWIAGKPAS